MANYRLAAERAARKYGVDPAIFKAMINQESRFREGVKSPAGARDIAQFMPDTAKAYGVTLGDNRVTDDLEGAARYLADNLKKTGGNYSQALSIYNSGRPDAYRDPGFAGGQTYNYVRSILAAAQREGGPGRAASQGSTGQGYRTTTRTRTVGGVDNRAARGAAIAQFIQSSGKTGDADPVNLALKLRSLADVPGRKVTETTRTKTSGGKSFGASKGMGPLRELFWQGQGGVDVKNGVKQPQGFVSGHQDHVHVASGPKTVRELGRLAQQMGLHVGENPAFGGVHPVHVKGSYHYKGEAIDVSGPPRLMAHFAAVVAHRYGIKVRN